MSVVNGERLLLSNVTALTLYKGNMTTGRRSVPIPQVSCVGGSANCPNWGLPNTLQCINKGSDGVDSQWECIAEVHPRLKFGETTVACEGYDYPTDDYVLSGSCGVEYTLNWTDVKSDEKSSSVGLLLGFILLISLSHICAGPSNRSSNYLSGVATGYAVSRLSRSHRGYGGLGTTVSRGFGRTRRR